MELKEMILHYRDTGQRVDEVLYQTVIEHIERAQELEKALSEPKLNLWSRVHNERLRANGLRKENKHIREQLKLIISDTHCEEHDYVSVRHLIRKRAEGALEDEK